MKPPQYALDALWMSYGKSIERNWEANSLFLGGLRILMKCKKNWIQPGQMPVNLKEKS